MADSYSVQGPLMDDRRNELVEGNHAIAQSTPLPAETKKQLLTHVSKLAFPFFVLNSLQAVTALVQVHLVAKLGSDAAQGAYAADTLLAFVGALTHLVIQSQPYIAAAYAAGDDERSCVKIKHVVQSTWLLALCVSVPGVVFLQLSQPLSDQVFKYPSNVTSVVHSICRPLSWAVPFQMLVVANQILVTNTGGESLLYGVAIFDIIFACVGSYLLVDGKAGLPNCGASAIGYIGLLRMAINCCIYFGYLFFSGRYNKYHLFREFSATKDFCTILKESSPVAIIALSVSGVGIVIASWAQKLGGDRAIVMQIAILWNTMFSIIPKSIVAATGIYIAKNNGIGNWAGVEQYARTSWMMSLVFMAIPSLFFGLLPKSFCRVVFDPDEFSPYLQQHLVGFFMLLSALNIAQTLQNAYVSNLENMHKTVLPGVINVGSTLLMLPVSYGLGVASSWDLAGITIGSTSAAIMATVLMYCHWQKVVAKSDERQEATRLSIFCCVKSAPGDTDPDNDRALLLPSH